MRKDDDAIDDVVEQCSEGDESRGDPKVSLLSPRDVDYEKATLE